MDPEPLRILLVDGSPLIQAMIRQILGKGGYHVDVVSSGLEALDAIEREDYDVVLMDVGMPGMDGLETMRRLREARPASRRPPIIALASASSPEVRERCFLLGMDEFLPKPVRGTVLIDVVGRIGSRGRAARERDAQELRALSGAEVPPSPASAVRRFMHEVVVDGMLGVLQIWSDEEWARIPLELRPRTVTYRAGLGWVGVLPAISLN